jgi:hypothetical protein
MGQALDFKSLLTAREEPLKLYGTPDKYSTVLFKFEGMLIAFRQKVNPLAARHR